MPSTRSGYAKMVQELRATIMVLRSVRARYSKGVFEPLDDVDLAEDQEVLLTVEDKPSPKRDPEAMRAGAGGWIGQHDPDELIRMLYEARITGSREPPDL